MQTLRIFTSSPGDVAEERQITGKVIERIARGILEPFLKTEL